MPSAVWILGPSAPARGQRSATASSPSIEPASNSMSGFTTSTHSSPASADTEVRRAAVSTVAAALDEVDGGMLADPLDAAVRRAVVHDRDRHRIRRRRRQRREELGEEVARKVGDDDDPQAGTGAPLDGHGRAPTRTRRDGHGRRPRCTAPTEPAPPPLAGDAPPGRRAGRPGRRRGPPRPGCAHGPRRRRPQVGEAVGGEDRAPHAIASSTGRPKPSPWAGYATTSAPPSSAGTRPSGTKPGRSTRSVSGRAATAGSTASSQPLRRPVPGRRRRHRAADLTEGRDERGHVLARLEGPEEGDVRLVRLEAEPLAQLVDLGRGRRRKRSWSTPGTTVIRERSVGVGGDLVPGRLARSDERVGQPARHGGPAPEEPCLDADVR